MEFEFRLKSLKGPKRVIYIYFKLTDPNEPEDYDEKGLEGHFKIQGFDEGFEDAAKAEKDNPFYGFKR